MSDKRFYVHYEAKEYTQKFFWEPQNLSTVNQLILINSPELDANYVNLLRNGEILPRDVEVNASGDDLYLEKTATKKCNRRGCGRDFTEAENGAHSCQFHPGQPIFHEGNKGWTCCSPRVLEFGEIFGIPGCASGPHSDVEEVVKPMETTVGRKQTATGTTSDGTEIYGSASSSASGGGQSGPKKAVVAVERAVPVQFEDPADAVIELGSKCQRNGCTATYQSPGSREESCWHHPGVVVFHDASKGWSCCKPRVADFSDLFQIEGCSQGRHNFVKIAKQESVACRMDYYQAGSSVNISVFAKNVDKCDVKFAELSCHIEILFKDSTTFSKDIAFPEATDPSRCSFKVGSVKVELKVVKLTPNEWQLSL